MCIAQATTIQTIAEPAGAPQNVASLAVAPLYEFIQKLELHQQAIAGGPSGPTAWSALWTLPQAITSTPGEVSKASVLFAMVNMAEEEVDVQEACDAGLVDREDLVDPASKLFRFPSPPLKGFLYEQRRPNM